MKRNQIWQDIELELRKEKKRHPNYPDHVAAQAGIVCRESGELMNACLDFKYERKEMNAFHLQQKDAIKDAAIQTVVSAIRFLENFK